MPDQTETTAEALAPFLAGRSFENCWADYERDGYVIFPGIMPAEEADRIRNALSPYLTHQGRNDFEGTRTNRVYGLLAKSPVFSDLVTHPLALAFAHAELGPSFLLSACLAINLHPGETVQPWHTDDGYVHIPAPRQACAISTFWTIDETTEENGATEIIPGSHTWPADHPDLEVLRGSLDESFQTTLSKPPALQTDIRKAVMPAGSLMIAKGNLWHRGGSNQSARSRLIVTPQYCAGWMRQIENMTMSVPREIAATLPKRVRELMGYSIHPPFIGYVDGMHPERALS